MNIFILAYDPVEAAVNQCDQHVVKMVLESAQMLCAPFPAGEAPYKRTHYNHPCTQWCRASKENYTWLLNHANALAAEYTYRYGKTHKSQQVIEWCNRHKGQLSFSRRILTPFALAMPEQYKVASAVDSYRNYYINEKLGFAKWNKRRNKPTWAKMNSSQAKRI